MFIGLYVLSLFFFIYLNNRKEIFSYPPGKIEPVSIVMPCYNESAHIGRAIESLLELNYPMDKLEIIVVDDQSKDNSTDIVRSYARKYRNVRLIINKRNSGGAAEPTNIGVRAAKYDYIAVADADSFPEKDALLKMIGFLQNDLTVGGVTCAVLSKRPETFMQKLQALEYTVIAFNRKLLDFVDSVYVTPGPFALYRKKVLLEIGLFDVKNMTQDIEIVWRMLSKGYKARMCLGAHVYTATPIKFKQWWKQRVRWNIGGTQTMTKYRSLVFRNGMLGNFIIPFFSVSLFIGLFGLILFCYLMTRRLGLWYLSAKYSLAANTTLLTMQDLSFVPSVLNFFGGALFILGIAFTLLALTIIKQREFKNKNIFNLMFYLIIYLAVYPFIMITGLTKLLTGRYSWGK
ncbi:MAG: glycosyltransferase family 2 protein [archaeon]